MTLRAQDMGNTDITRRTIQVSKSGTNNQLELPISENTVSVLLFISFYGQIDSKIFLDNLSLIVQ